MRWRVTGLIVLLAAACSQHASFAQPPASAFTTGACRDLAPAVLQLGRTLHDIGDEAPTSSQAASLKTAQNTVRQVQPHAPAALAAPVQDLVTTVGVMRLRDDAHSYDHMLQTAAMAAYRSLVQTCTAPGTS